MIKPGDCIDRYVIEELLGQGGMGSVFRARDDRLRRRVALKVVLPEHAAGDPQSGARMLREARAAAALDHPNAVSVFDVGEWEGGVFIAMELIQGRSLRAFVGQASVPVGTRIRWMADAARALGAAHKAGLIHRDIKPENIMVRDDGVVKVLDFGIARRSSLTNSGQAAALSTQTGGGAIAGTPMYMAPEQIRGEELDTRADQFAWGATTFELLTGELPWGPDRDPLRVLAGILSLPAPSVRSRLPEVPAVVDEAIARALSKEPAERFTSMEEVAERIDPRDSSVRVEATNQAALALANTIAAPAHTAPATAAPATRRNVWPIALAAALLLMAATSTWLASNRTPPLPGSGAPSHTASAAPVSSNQQAEVAWQRAQLALRNASTAVAYRDLDLACKHDPALGPALLRMALIDFQAAPSYARELLQRAAQVRDRMTPRDRALLQAVERWMIHDDADGWLRGLEQATRDYPRDGMLQVELARARAHRADLRGAARACDDALSVDGQLALAWLRKARALMLLNESDAAAAALDQCLRLSASATDCLEDRSSLKSRAGRCQDALADAQAVVNADPKSESGYYLKASLLAGMNRPREAVLAALQQRWARYDDPQDRKLTELSDRIAYEQLQGRFDEALRLVGDWTKLIAQATDLADHAAPAAVECELHLEMGKPELASKVASSFLKRMDAYSPAHRNQDVSFIFLESQYRAGVLTKNDYETRRETWFRVPQHRWLHGFAAAARTESEAREALAAVAPDAGDSVSRVGRSLATELALGRVFALAGRFTEALAVLGPVCSSCDAMADAMAHTQAHLYLGMALAHNGDTAGACKAWDLVTQRWGDRATHAVTAQQAREKASAAGCKP